MSQVVADEPTASTDRAETPRARPRNAMRILIAVTLLAALGSAGWTMRNVQDERDQQDRDHVVLAAGREAAVAFTSYDYRHIDEDLDRVAGMSTGKFRDQFTKALGALTAAIQKAHGVSTGKVTQAGIVRVNNTSAVIIAAVDAQITNTDTKGPSVRRYRLQITLNRVDQDWLIADIQPVA